MGSIMDPSAFFNWVFSSPVKGSLFLMISAVSEENCLMGIE